MAAGSGSAPASDISRRRFLRYAGAAIGAGALAACGASGTDRRASSVSFGGEPAGEVSFANWPLYIDQAKDREGNPYHPSLRAFSKETGIEVAYHEPITDYPSFFGKLRPQLSAGQDPGFDLIVIAGREEAVMMENGWLVELDDLANPAKVGRSSVGMIEQEMADLVMVNLGIDPPSSGPEEWKEAAAWLVMQREAGTVRGYYDISWMDEFRNGNVVATMAWPGDIALYRIWQGYPQLEFVIPEGGALRWSDDLAIPAGAQHPVDALMLMDFYYQPKVAVDITEWVLYISPVEGVQELIRRHAEQARDDGYKGYATKLEATADEPFLFPSDEVLGRTWPMRVLTTDEELEEWNDIFAPISQT
jgi:spermidine/putrescine transport system substrate-binding protein